MNEQDEVTWFQRLLGWVNWFRWKDGQYDAKFLAIDERFVALKQEMIEMAQDAVDTGLDAVRAEVASDFKSLQDQVTSLTDAAKTGNAATIQAEADKVTALVAELHAKYAPPAPATP